MIKKLLAFSVAPILSATIASAQCTPDYPYTYPGLYPDSLPHAFVGQSYAEVIQFLVPADTSMEYNGTTIPVDVTSVEITGVDWSGLDAKGFSYACNPGSCEFPGGTEGCLLVSGSAPTSDMIGSYQLFVYLEYHLTLPTFGGIPFDTSETIDYYYIHIEEDSTSGIGASIINTSKFQVLQNTPNPFATTTKITYASPTASSYTFEVYNMIGETVYSKEIEAKKGINTLTFDGTGFEEGIYLYSLSNDKSKAVKRMTISK